MKICTKCNIEKPYSQFSSDKGKLDGKFNACKECEKIRRRKWDEDNKAHNKALSLEYRQEHKEKIHEDNIRNYYINREDRIKMAREFTINNREIINEKKRQYYIEHRDRELKGARSGRGITPRRLAKR